MTYQVLARKWRPRFFREMVGQEHVLKALINALDHNRLHQAYLFTGTRGVGKTTIGRILAKCLNCETGVTSEPCGSCSACVEISQGNFVDLIEIDAASHTGVDNMRALTENAQYTPSKGRYKVYLIDEVHMLSASSFNALLKTLEEPPEHAKFLLATTDPQKLPATVLSRCLQFHLKNMVPERIVAHLQHILERESIQAEESALWSLARSAQGSMRDALSLTDQAIAFGQGRVMAADVAAMLGTIDQQTVYQLACALIEHNAGQIMQVISEASEMSPDYAAILDALLLLLHRMTVAQLVPDAVDNSEGDKEQVIELATRVSAGELQLFYQMGLLGKRDLYLAPDLRTGLEMAVLRMLAFRPQNSAEPVNGVRLTQENPVKKPEAVATEVKAAPAAPVVNRSRVDSIMQAASIPVAPVAEVVAAPIEEAAAPAPSRVAAVLDAPKIIPPWEDEPAIDAEVVSASVVEVEVIQNPLPRTHTMWLEQFASIPFSGLLRAVVAECVLLKVEGQRVVLALDPSRSQLYNEKHAEQIAQVLSQWSGEAVNVKVEQDAHGLQTPAEYLAVQKNGRRDAALAELNQDSIVQYFIEQYQAQLVPESLVVKGERL